MERAFFKEEFDDTEHYTINKTMDFSPLDPNLGTFVGFSDAFSPWFWKVERPHPSCDHALVI